MDLISVIMPVYNVENYVGEAIESILNQTYTNIEFIIVDDCSTDNSFKICKMYAEKDSRIKLFKNECNKKIAATLNFALTKVSGKYVVRMDGDDISVNNRLEKMKEYLDTHKDISLVGTSVITIDSDGTEIGKVVYLDDLQLIKKTCCLRSPILHIWMTYKTVYDRLEGYRLVAPTEDYDFILRCITAGHKCTNISDFFAYKVRIGREGNSSSTFGLRKIKSHKYTAKNYIKRLKKGKDDFSIDAYNKIMTTSKISERLFNLSSKFLYKASISRKTILLLCFYSILSCISPWQIHYLYNSLKYRIIVRSYK